MDNLHSNTILVKGMLTDSLPVNDRGLQYGDGVWETIAIKDGQAMQLSAHLLRLQRGIDALAIVGLDIELLKREIAQLIRIKLNTEQNTELGIKQNTKQSTRYQAILKIIITRGSCGRGYSPQGCDKPTRILSLHPWPDYPASYTETGIHITLCETRLSHNSQLAGFKHLNRLEQVLARAEVGASSQEGLVRDHENNVIEATMSNVFIVKTNGEMVTPDLSLCGIEGIARSCIISELEKMDVKLSIAQVTLKDIEQAEGLFLTNSIITIWPVKQFQQIRYAIPDSVKALQKRIQGRL